MDLDTLDLSGINVPLTPELVTGINSHSCLRKVILRDVRQLSPLSNEFLYSTSLSRTHFHTYNVSITAVAPSSYPLLGLRALLARPTDAPHIREVIIDSFTLPDWANHTFKSLEKLRVHGLIDDTAPSSKEFFSRHNRLTEIRLSGTGLRDLRAIETIPFLSPFCAEAHRRNLSRSFWFDTIHIADRTCGCLQYSRFDASQHLAVTKVHITQKPIEVMSFLLAFLPTCDTLHLIYEPEHREIANFIPMASGFLQLPGPRPSKADHSMRRLSPLYGIKFSCVPLGSNVFEPSILPNSLFGMIHETRLLLVSISFPNKTSKSMAQRIRSGFPPSSERLERTSESVMSKITREDVQLYHLSK